MVAGGREGEVCPEVAFGLMFLHIYTIQTPEGDVDYVSQMFCHHHLRNNGFYFSKGMVIYYSDMATSIFITE